MAEAGWYPDPKTPGQQRYWTGEAWSDHIAPLAPAMPVVQQVVYQQRGPARSAHGLGYLLTVGWWWLPLKWSGRVMWWLFLWPAGLWRSMRNSRVKQERRARR